MKIHDLVFSDKPIIRIQRHLIFWVGRGIFYYVTYLGIYLMTPTGPGTNKGNSISLFLDVRPILVFVCIDIIFCYLIVYVLLPLYLLKKKYLLFCLSIFILTVPIFVIRSYFELWYSNKLNSPSEVIADILWYNLITFINSGGPPVICLLFVAIKMFKLWYLKEEQKLVLMKENGQSELNLLKAQVSPHFLFNTLNNIYSLVLHKSPKGPELLKSLSDTLHYMTDECNISFLAVEKELKMIKDYTNLEKVRYGDRLRLEISIKGDYSNKLIAPLILIPFVENSFKHGASKMLRHPWIKLQIIVEGNTLLFKLSNSKPLESNHYNGKKGIGLKNIQKRLAILYPAKHDLNISSTDNEYVVKMSIPLNEITKEESEKFVTHQTILYA